MENGKENGKKQDYKTLRDLIKLLSFYNTLDVAEAGVNEVAKALGMAPSKVYRLLSTLAEEGFFEKNVLTDKYRVGIGFFEIGLTYIFNSPLRNIMNPHIEQMAKETGLTASWAIMHKNKVTVIGRVQNLNIDLLTYRVGFNISIHTTSLGKILTAYLPEDKLEELLKSIELKKLTEKSIVNVNEFKEHLKMVKARGYSTDEGETHHDIYCISAPVRGGNGDVVAGICLMDETTRTSPEKILGYAEYIKEKGLFVSRQLGYMRR